MDGSVSSTPPARQRSKNNRQLLPVEAYTSEAWFAREQRELFTRTWSFCGMTEELKAPGDYKCVTIGGAPYVLLRDGQGQLRGYHNICRHRGSRLLEGSGNTGSTMVCFYHRWSYALEGSLLGVPQARAEFPDLDKSCNSLLQVQVATWRNLIFLNPDLTAESLDTWLAGAPDQMLPPYMLHAKGPYTAVRLDTSEVHPLDSHSVMREDIYACEAVQEGMHSPQWAVGPLSSWEESLTFFQQQILDFVPIA